MSYIKKRKSKKIGTIVPEIMTDERTFSEWMSDHANTLIYAGGAILFVLFISLGLFWAKSHKEKVASEDMNNALRLYWNTIAQQPSDDPEAGSSALESTLGTFSEVADNYGKNVQGKAAVVYSSRVLYRLGRYAEAAQLMEKIRTRDPQFTSDINAVYLLGKCYEASGDFTKAMDAYSSMRDSAVGEMKAVLDLDIARCSELTGDTDRAITLYEEIKADFPDSVFAAKSGKKLVTLGVFSREEI